MMRRRLMWAVIISAGVHLAVLVMLLALSARPGRASVLRVQVLPSGGATAELRNPPAVTEARPPSESVAPSAQRLELSPRPAPVPARGSMARTARPPPVAASDRPPAPVAPSGQSVSVEAARAPGPPDSSRAIPVQSDIWVLTPTVEGAAEQSSEGSVPSPGRDAGARGGSGGNAGAPPGQRSLLAELGRRLARSAARCTPSEASRLGWSKDRGLAVPVHFCLDAKGRPSDVGLQGSTGSELLDRAARDCVVPGAVPLPPAPGCYTVPVLFPVRG
jgi:outer membrane biosynthesis protein TonB